MVLFSCRPFDSRTAKRKIPHRMVCVFFGDPYGNRTHVTAVKGRCLNRLTNGPGSGDLIRTGDIPGMNRVLYQLSYAAISRQLPKFSFVIISTAICFVKRKVNIPCKIYKNSIFTQNQQLIKVFWQVID